MANAVTLKDKSGVECYPKSHVKQIVDSSGKTQETINSEMLALAEKSGGGNMILEWNTDVATTRKQVKTKYRKEGLQISYKDPDKGWINEQYIGIAVTDTEWASNSNWKKLDADVINLIGDTVGDEIPSYHKLANNGVNADTGDLTPLSGSYVCSYPIYGYKYILTNLEATATNVGLAFYDEDNNYVSGHKELGTGVSRVLIKIPENSCLLRIRRTSQNIKDKLIGLSFDDNANVKLYLKPETYIYFKDGKEGVASGSDIASTTPIFCLGKKTVTITVRANSSSVNETGLAFYGENGYISGVNIYDSTVSQATSKKKTVNIPKGAIYLRSTYFKDKSDFSVIFDSDSSNQVSTKNLSGYECENYTIETSVPSKSNGINVIIAPLPISGFFTLSGYTNRPKSTLKYYTEDPMSDLSKSYYISSVDIGGSSEKTLKAPASAKFFGMFVKVPDDMDDTGNVTMTYEGELYPNAANRINIVSTNIIATTETYILEQIIKEDKEYFRFSKDLGATWVEKENTIGAIGYVHWFSDGTCLICGHNKCYTTKDFVKLTESSVFDEDGSLFKPDSQHFFYSGSNQNLYYKLDGKETLIWSDYNTAVYNSRVWMTQDRGKTIKCILKNKVTQAEDGEVINVRHFHCTFFDEKEQTLYITAGDYDYENILIIGNYSKEIEKFTFKTLGPEDKYKIGMMFVKDEIAFFLTDYADLEGLYSGLGYCYKDNVKEGDFGNHYLYKDKDKTAFLAYYADSNNNHILLGDGAVFNAIWVAKNNYDFKKIKFYNRTVSVVSAHGPNFKGDVIVRGTDGYSTPETVTERLRINRQGFMFNLTETLRQSGITDFQETINIFKNNIVD